MFYDSALLGTGEYSHGSNTQSCSTRPRVCGYGGQSFAMDHRG